MTDAQLRAERRRSMTGQRERLVTTRPARAPGQQELTCSPCGAENRASARYCRQCGATLPGEWLIAEITG